MQIHANGVSINYELAGSEDAPCVTFSHSLACDLAMWDDQAAFLRKRYRVLRYDVRGHGGSEATEGAYNFDMLIDDAVGLWDSLGIKKSHWIGLSLGAMTGYGLALKHPDRLVTMIACDGRADAAPTYADYFGERIRITREQGMKGLVEPTVTRWFTDKSLTENLPVIDKMRNMILHTNPLGHIGCCEAIRTLAYGARLGGIKVPTLVVCGAEDVGAPPEVMREIHKAIPGSEQVVIPGAGHISNVENPSVFNVAMGEFLARH
jgi:3-oxoadipate enol-lactonase